MTATDYRPEKSYAQLTPGDSLRVVRELQELTQTELAERTGIPQGTISALERGTKTLGADRAAKLAVALAVHPAVLLFPGWKVEPWTPREASPDVTALRRLAGRIIEGAKVRTTKLTAKRAARHKF